MILSGLPAFDARGRIQDLKSRRNFQGVERSQLVGVERDVCLELDWDWELEGMKKGRIEGRRVCSQL